MRGFDAWLAREPGYVIDPHNPWSKVTDWDGYVTVQYGDGEHESDVVVCYGKGPDAEEHADRAVFKLNAAHPDTHCVNEHGYCVVCGDIVCDLGNGEVVKVVRSGAGYRLDFEYSEEEV
jgi:hypothetical protein